MSKNANGILKLINKGSTSWINVQTIKWAEELGIQVFWLFLVGIPGESDAWYSEMASWLPLIAHLQPPSDIFSVQYHRFSSYHQRPADFGLTLTPNRCYQYIYPVQLESLNNLAYYFEDTSAQTKRKALTYPDKPARSGLKALISWVYSWKNLWEDAYSNPPVLEITDDGEQIHILDTRPCAVEREQVITGLAYWVYISCDRVAQSVLDLQPKIVGSSSTFAQHCSSLALLRRIRELDPKVITLMGGANCEEVMGLTTHREFPWVDFIVSGEGDDLFPLWLPLITHLEPCGSMYSIRYDRFSPYHEQPDRWGLTLLPNSMYAYIYPLPQEKLADLAYFFEDSQDLARRKTDATGTRFDRPGLEKLKACIGKWHQCWLYRFSKPEGLPILSMSDDGDRIIISDTRPCAYKSVQILEGLAYWVYKACDR